VSSVETAHRLPAPGGARAWLVPRGTVREKPERAEREQLDHDEVWLTVPEEWWVLCGHGRPDGSIARYELHAAAPSEVDPLERGVVRWIDLDLDLELAGNTIELTDEAEFHERARAMRYPDEVIRGAWKGISELAPRYTTEDWPFDGWMDEELRGGRAELFAGGGSQPRR
jgi:protein associated with RNAse G/E